MSPQAQQIADLVRDGRMIDAIKQLNAATGMGLKAAKDLLDAEPSAMAIDLALQGRDQVRRVQPGAPSAEVRRLAASGEMIAAIKLLRKETGLGLKQAKEEVDKLPRPPARPLPWKWLLWIGGAIALALAAWLRDLPLI